MKAVPVPVPVPVLPPSPHGSLARAARREAPNAVRSDRNGNGVQLDRRAGRGRGTGTGTGGRR
jgi:hypothetical protein